MTEFRQEDEVSVRGTVLSFEGRAVHVIVGENVVVVPIDDVQMVTRSFHEGDRVQVAGLPAKYDVNSGTILKRLEDGVYLVKIDHTFGAESYAITARARLTHLDRSDSEILPTDEEGVSAAVAEPAPTSLPAQPIGVAADNLPTNNEPDEGLPVSEETVAAVSRPLASLTSMVTSIRRGNGSSDDHAVAVTAKPVIELAATGEEHLVDASAGGADHDGPLKDAEVAAVSSVPPLAANVDTAGLASAFGEAIGEKNSGLGFDVDDAAKS